MSIILLIGAEIEVRKEVAQNLRTQGFEIRVIESGIAALEQLGQVMPDCILCDFTLPDINGHEVWKRLKADPKTKSVPFVMMTDMVHPLMEGARYPLLPKPLRIESLAMHLQNVFATR